LIVGTFVHHRAERRNRIQEMRRNGVLSVPVQTNPSQSIIDEKLVNKEEHTCVICLDTYMKSDKIKSLPNCSHWFHANCITAWLVGNSTCPVCRAQA